MDSGKYEIEDFIGHFDGLVTSEFCKKIINHFQRVEEINKTVSRSEHNKVSPLEQENKIYYFINEDNQILIDQGTKILSEFNQAIEAAAQIYRKEYPVLNQVARHQLSYDVKIQKTMPGEGYHIWHCERDGVTRARRLLLVMLYLNDVESGGETEWLYQHKRIEPKEGRLVICPSSFTHFHRGNPPLSGPKYMINGWVEYIV
jgi:hypothetical protein